jgi:transposase
MTNNFLTAGTRLSLKLQHRSEKDGRTRDRIKAVLLSDKGWTFRQISDALLLDEETVSKHVSEYQEKHKLSVQTGGSSGKLSSNQAHDLLAHLEKSTYLKVFDICAYVKHTYHVTYTVSGMTSWLQRHGFSYKKPKPTPAKADPIKQADFIQAYENLLNETPENEPILFLDGVHPTMATKVVYGWIRRGKDKLIATTASRTRINLMGALNLETMGVDIKDYPTINSDAMVDYWAYLRSQYPNSSKLHVILDQGPYNKSKKTQEAAEKYGIVLHYLPAYSPNLNPIERLWKVMNEYVRNNRFFESAKIFKKDIMNFFENTWNQIASSMVDRINDTFQTFNKSIL